MCNYFNGEHPKSRLIINLLKTFLLHNSNLILNQIFENCYHSKVFIFLITRF